MNNKPNEPTRSAPEAHKGQTAADTKKKYEIMLGYTQHSMAKVIVEARSLAGAQRMADNIEPEDVDDFDPVDGKLRVEWVELYEGGQDDE